MKRIILGVAAFAVLAFSAAVIVSANPPPPELGPRTNPWANDSPCPLSSKYRSENYFGGVCSQGQQHDYDAALARTYAYFAEHNIVPEASLCSPNFVDGSKDFAVSPRPEQQGNCLVYVDTVRIPIDIYGEAHEEFPMINGLPADTVIRDNINAGLAYQVVDTNPASECYLLEADECLAKINPTNSNGVPSNDPAPAHFPVTP